MRLQYDAHFRLKLSSNSSLKWSDTDPELIATWLRTPAYILQASSHASRPVMGLVQAAFLELATLEELLSTVKWSHNNCDNTINLPHRMSSLSLLVLVDPPVDRGVCGCSDDGCGDDRCGNVGDGSCSWTYFLRSCQKIAKSCW